MIHIFPIFGLRDNLIWTVRMASACVIVDPGEAQPVIQALEAQKLTPSAILVTHHHWDHTQGIPELRAQWPVPVFGPTQETIVGRTHPVREGDSVQLLEGALELVVLEIPGHTRDHIAYYGSQSLFSGDTLFGAGCGRVFEGTFEEMYASLLRLSALPEHTHLYCGHEYTEANLKFAAWLEPDNLAVQMRLETVQKRRAIGQVTLPSRLSEEHLTNPFLRCSDTRMQAAVNRRLPKPCLSPVDCFRRVRQWKDAWV
jgi:hydroxyacylglutathione hydrolase